MNPFINRLHVEMPKWTSTFTMNLYGNMSTARQPQWLINAGMA